ncbi:T9SS type A sorting domain-containing protein [Flavobacterium cheniae]|uniref:Putative repeat protein (TIGR01451 family)/predicted secreted protein (Por secretion system target) n=1 Tax=Flavobacterium cheniae TaxID=295428 RepID=A0A562KSB5_9FLAO|nr:T9SS type A sorting domain-containing protein [Flavobacterium cheniae]TDR25483.1 putative repeat protein (TIGR01451 family)/predicted secreted protein (Por secretion system target) [Flavobacterium cheniae]TWH98331.1 putative repeat protein (TIGR01451 family)/predicted secreted protein (Por secretion system target) [Flavobacterium cheniae]
MKKLYFLFFLSIGVLGNAQIVNIPDANFKTRLLAASSSNTIAKNLSGSYFKIDSNSDGIIQVSEAEQVSYIYLNQYNGAGIYSLVGINEFPNLTYFSCSDANLYELDIHGLQYLEVINVIYSGIDIVTLYDLPTLKTLSVWYNNLTELDLSNLSSLLSLNCYQNSITSLDISMLTNLNTLTCNNNQLVSLNMKNGRNQTIQNGMLQGYSGYPTLRFICVDESELSYVENIVSNIEGSELVVVNDYCTFVPGGEYFTVNGNIKFDSNNNGCDVSDINYPSLNFSISDGTNSGSLISNASGNYSIPVQAGNHTITPNFENPSYFNVSPTSFSIDFPTQISPFTQDFCVTANGFKHDVEVVLIPTVPARPGFDATYKLVYRNKGNQVENGSISLTFDDTRLDYVAANPVYNSFAVNNFTWNYTNLQPFESREITLTLNVNSPMEVPAVNNGDQLDFLAQITPFTNDEMQYDNISALKQIVVGSYDPNDKTCIQGETIEPSQVGNYMHYIIRFENTGTFPAENIVVKDMIDLTKFDITTLVPLKSSHDFFTRINGNKVEFIFENINLDFNDATNDGYVVFKIKTLPTLVLGDTFTNDANIYFDYNFPITTNTYTTTVAALSNQYFDFGTYFTLYPNPAKDVLNMQAKQDVAINSVEIYNQLGQIVMATTNAINSVDVANLASGTYFVKVNTEKGSANAKFVKE